MNSRSPRVLVAATVLGFVFVTNTAARLRLAEDSVRPGDTVRISIRDQRLNGNRPLRALFGKLPASASFVGTQEVDVVVPMLSVGQSTLSLYQGDRLLGKRDVTILDAATRRLTLSYGSNGIALLAASRAAGSPTGHVRSNEPRLSFDLLNSNGVVVYSGTILDPAHARPEVLTRAPVEGGPASIGRGSVQPSGVFFINIPSPPGNVVLKIYRAAGGVDLFTAKGRSQRVLVANMEVVP